jgi:hypothetical protein
MSTLTRARLWDVLLIAATALIMAFVNDPHVAERTLPRWISWASTRRLPLSVLCYLTASTAFVMCLKFVTLGLLRRIRIAGDPIAVWRHLQPALLVSIASWGFMPLPLGPHLYPGFYSLMALALVYASMALLCLWPFLLARHVYRAHEVTRKKAAFLAISALAVFLAAFALWTTLAEAVCMTW